MPYIGCWWSESTEEVTAHGTTDGGMGCQHVCGNELALDPGGDRATGRLTHWGVADADSALGQLLDAGATKRGSVHGMEAGSG